MTRGKRTHGKGVHVTAAAAAIAVAGTLACVASEAEASIAASLVARTEGRTESCAIAPSASWDATGSASPFSLGAFQNDFQDSAGALFKSWAVELGPTVDGGAVYIFDPVAIGSSALGAAKVSVMRDLFARWIDPSTGRVVGAASVRVVTSAAFQLAVWEVVHENFATTDASTLVARMSLSTGAFRSAASAETIARYGAIVSSLGQGGFQACDLELLGNPVAQDQIRVVPAPAGLVLLAGAVARASHSRRRR